MRRTLTSTLVLKNKNPNPKNAKIRKFDENKAENQRK